MTIKKRLALSNVLMIIVPIVSTALIGLMCIGFMWLTLINGVGIGIHDEEEFSLACTAIAGSVKEELEKGGSYSHIESILSANNISLRIKKNGDIVYSHGTIDEDNTLYRAIDMIGGAAIITQLGEGLYADTVSIDGDVYSLYLFGSYETVRSYENMKTLMIISIVLIAIAIVLSIFLTDRFLTRFIFNRIEEPLDILANGVREIHDGNLDYRIEYNQDDEFKPVCNDFNEMAIRLKTSSELIVHQDRSRKELIAGISHDIRSPLTSIKAYVEGLLDGIATNEEARRRYLEIIRTKADSLEHIVSQLFLFSKLELGEYPADIRAIRLDKAIENTISTVMEEYADKGLDIHLDLDCVIAKADPLSVERIVLNIIENSLKYNNKERGRIEISLHEDRSILTETKAVIAFSDDGPGVPTDSLPRLFEVFYRSDSSRQNPQNGSGLGLAIVATAVRQMNGTISASIGELGGLKIEIELPI